MHQKGKNKVHKTSVGFVYNTKERNKQPVMFRTCNDNWSHYQFYTLTSDNLSFLTSYWDFYSLQIN